jgi:hypothetical protein
LNLDFPTNNVQLCFYTPIGPTCAKQLLQTNNT